jgi:aminotransferase
MLMKTFDEVGLQYYRPEGAYYILVDVPDHFKNDTGFTDYLLKKIGVAVLPGSALYHNEKLGNRKVRVAFCKKDTTLQEVRRLLQKMAEKPKQKVIVKSKP